MNPMTVYDGLTPIGKIRDFGPGRVMAYDFIESGRVALGFFPTRRDAMRAISVRHGSGTHDAKRAK